MVMVFILKRLERFGYYNALRVVHINHNTRKEQKGEQELVRSYCAALSISFHSQKLEGLNPQQNFEYNARLKRYEAFYKIAKPHEKIILAHHIDDSFEWTMLQSLRSSNIEGLVGIPVVNARIIRPFMCVTKKQISHYANFFDLPFIEDPTNELIKYERNFIRNNLIAAFKDRYKKYLKHYVYRHNEISRRLGLHYIYKNQTSFSLSFSQDSVLLYSVLGKEDYSGVEGQVLKGLQFLNPNSRGKVSKQIENIVTALGNNKYGPVSLTSGVLAYIDFNLILITKMRPRNKTTYDFSKDRVFSFDEFTNYITTFLRESSKLNTHKYFPFIVTIEEGKFEKRQFNNSWSFALVNELKEKKLTYYPALKLLREWSKKKNKHIRLKLNILKLE